MFSSSPWAEIGWRGRARAAGRCGPSRRGPHQRPQADQIVDGGHEEELPFDFRGAAMAELPQAADGLHPPKHFFDAFAMPLAEGVAGMPRRPLIDRTAGALRDMRGDANGARGLDPRPRVIGFVAAGGRGPRRQGLEQGGRGVAFGRAAGVTTLASTTRPCRFSISTSPT